MLFDINRNCFINASSRNISGFTAYDFAPSEHIFLGSVIGIYPNDYADVLMCSFLFEEPVKIPSKTTKFSDKDIRKKINNLFEKCVLQLKEKNSAYKEINALKISYPTVEQMYLINNDYIRIFAGYDIAFGNYKFRPLFENIFFKNTNIVCIHTNKKIYFAKCDIDADKPEIEIPHNGKFNFFCVFKKVKLFNN